MQTVVVLGASDNPERYSNKAVRILKEKGFHVVPVHPTLKSVEGISVAPSLDDVAEPVDILSVYVRPEVFLPMMGSVEDMKPGRVILNPGTESPAAAMALERLCIPYHQGCTITMAQSGLL
jgi:uncharacterized protein